MNSNKKVLITGGSSGIGKAMVELFVGNEYEVHFTYQSGRDRAEALRESIGKTKAFAHHWDARKRVSLEKLVSAVPEPDVLINNAGLGSDTVKKLTDDVFEQDELLLKVNALAPLWLIRSYLPILKKKGGKIINISSVGGGITQFPGFSPSDGMSKAALAFLTRQLAAELSHSRVDVFAICPGATETPMFGASTLNKLSENERKALTEKLPGGRLICPVEIARIALFLCREEARVLRGTVLDASLGLGVNPGLLQK